MLLFLGGASRNAIDIVTAVASSFGLGQSDIWFNESHLGCEDLSESIGYPTFTSMMYVCA